jgi:DNA modification methylase
MVLGSKLLENIDTVKDYLIEPNLVPLFLQADSYAILKLFPDACIDCVITSPPYWGHRTYANGGERKNAWEKRTNS